MKFAIHNINSPKIDLYEDKIDVAAKLKISMPTLNKLISYAEMKSFGGIKSTFFNHKKFIVFILKDRDIHKSNRGGRNSNLNK